VRICSLFFLLVVAGLVSLHAGTIASVGSANTTVGSTVNIPVLISGVSDLYAFQFDLSYNPSLLQANVITEGGFLPSGGATFFIPGMIDNVAGAVTFNADTLIGSTSGVGGSGTLMIVQFQIISPGTSPLVLSNVILLDSTLADISFTTQPGQVSTASTVPEPATLFLLGAGISALASWPRRHSIRHMAVPAISFGVISQLPKRLFLM
jgi:general secretion pathway protein D